MIDLSFFRGINRRYGSENKHLGPFTYTKSSYSPTIGVTLRSGDYNPPGPDGQNHLIFNLWKHIVIVEMPPMLKNHAEDKGKSWTEYYPKAYGFVVAESALHLYFGQQTHSSNTTKNKVWSIPWMNWRYIRTSLYDPDGNHFFTLPEGKTLEERQDWYGKWFTAKDLVPKVVFMIRDFDGEVIRVETYIEEREWRFGTGWFSWLSLFRKPKVRRSLSINFDKEVGPEKGSWKGGLRGTGTVMTGEKVIDAFTRYCELEHQDRSGKYKITLLGLEP